VFSMAITACAAKFVTSSICLSVNGRPHPKIASDRPLFRTDSVILAISAEKDGNLRVVYARIGRWQGRPAWRGRGRAAPPQLEQPLRVTLG
jgi:hypothetical protein